MTDEEHIKGRIDKLRQQYVDPGRPETNDELHEIAWQCQQADIDTTQMMDYFTRPWNLSTEEMTAITDCCNQSNAFLGSMIKLGDNLL